MILKQGHTYRAMPHDGKVIRRIYRGGRCYYIASPYSPEATQALKAAFPQYWTAIRDYGVAHPQLVPFVNEDPMLIVSLVEVGKTRWLVTDGLACIQTQTILNGHSNITSYCNVPANLAGNQTLWCARESTNANTYTSFLLGSSIRADYGSTQTTTGRDIPRGKETKLQSIDGCFYLNGEKLTNREFVSFSTVNGVSLFASYSTGGVAPYTNVQNGFMQGVFIVEKEGKQVANICPFTRNGENGMLDILSGTFYPNANTQGAFTIQITDKAT